MKPRPAIVSAFGSFFFGIHCLSTICSMRTRNVMSLPFRRLRWKLGISSRLTSILLSSPLLREPYPAFVFIINLLRQPKSRLRKPSSLPKTVSFYNPFYFILFLTTFVASFFRRKCADHSFCLDCATYQSAPQEAAETRS